MTESRSNVVGHAAFERLLTRLDPDRDTAGQKFEDLRRRLVRFFDWRGAAVPDECADVTLDRLALRLDDGVPIESLHAYAFAIARLVHLEQTRRPGGRTVSLDEAPDHALAQPARASTPWQDCLEHGLQALPDEQRQLILRYYAHDKQDKIRDHARLASELGITVSALRNRAQRVRDRLERSVAECVRARETT